MRFVYFYKTSDGIRHRATVAAPSREAAFAALRSEGIRPIKLFADESRPPWRRRAAVGAAALVVLALAAALALYLRQPVAVAAALAEPAYTNVCAQAAALARSRSRSLAAFHPERLTDYGLIAQLADVSPLMEDIARSRQALAAARVQLREFFRAAAAGLPRSRPDMLLAVQQLYVRESEALDADEARLDAAEYALMLLDENRGRWQVKAGEVEFADQALAEEFRLTLAQTDAASLRWRRELKDERAP